MPRPLLVTLASLSIIATLLGACGGGDGGASEVFKAGMVNDVGGINDKSFNATSSHGMELAQKELGVEVAYLESQQQTDYAANITQFLDQDYDMIITVGFLLGEDKKLCRAES